MLTGETQNVLQDIDFLVAIKLFAVGHYLGSEKELFSTSLSFSSHFHKRTISCDQRGLITQLIKVLLSAWKTVGQAGSSAVLLTGDVLLYLSPRRESSSVDVSDMENNELESPASSMVRHILLGDKIK